MMRLPNAIQEGNKTINRFPRKIILRIGIYGLFANLAGLLLGLTFGPLLVPLITIFVGYLATKRVFEQTQLSENPPIFWDGARIGMISGSIATLPIFFLSFLIGLYGLYIYFYFGDLYIGDGQAGPVWLWAIVSLLLAGLSIILSMIAGGVTATKLLRKPNNPV